MLCWISSILTITFLVLAPLRQTFIIDALWWRWVSMLVLHVPLLIMEVIAMIIFSAYYIQKFMSRIRSKKWDKKFHYSHILSVLFPPSLIVTHIGTIATASWWFLLPAALPTLCAYMFLMDAIKY